MMFHRILRMREDIEALRLLDLAQRRLLRSQFQIAERFAEEMPPGALERMHARMRQLDRARASAAARELAARLGAALSRKPAS